MQQNEKWNRGAREWMLRLRKLEKGTEGSQATERQVSYARDLFSKVIGGSPRQDLIDGITEQLRRSSKQAVFDLIDQLKAHLRLRRR